jgi:hypothetical protein
MGEALAFRGREPADDPDALAENVPDERQDKRGVVRVRRVDLERRARLVDAPDLDAANVDAAATGEPERETVQPFRDRVLPEASDEISAQASGAGGFVPLRPALPEPFQAPFESVAGRLTYVTFRKTN